ncbi:MAG TPA: hypothetical protein VKT78_13950 [Fimbriimonadaceae bacterium]|nr:hypothetical protein [Fimbriimonadaceae bacterium]
MKQFEKPIRGFGSEGSSAGMLTLAVVAVAKDGNLDDREPSTENIREIVEKAIAINGNAPDCIVQGAKGKTASSAKKEFEQKALEADKTAHRRMIRSMKIGK